MSPAVLLAWAMSSLWMAMLLLIGWLRLRALRSHWRNVQLGGRAVMVSRRTGPAVVGFVHPCIVLPEWTLQMENRRRGLVLLHEEEHLRAHDARLLFFAHITLVAMPWNVALWYQVRRLRLAVEIDCDARVLRVHPDPLEYGDLLLDVGRRVHSGEVQMAALSEPVSFLARRIGAMGGARKQSRPAAMLALVTAAAAATIACQAPRPPVPAFGVRPVPAYLPAGGVAAAADSIPTVVWDGEQMTRDSLVRRVYGRTLSMSTSGVLEFVVDANDVVRSAGVRSGPRVYRSTDTTLVSRTLNGGYGSVPPADVASIEIDQTRYGFPEITSVIWVRLKPGARTHLDRGETGASRGAVAESETSVAEDSTSVASARAAAGVMRAQAAAADSQARLSADLAMQLARHQTEVARFQTEAARHAAEAEKLRIRLSALEPLRARLAATQIAGVGGEETGGFQLGYTGAARNYARHSSLPPPGTPLAAATRYYPELVANPPAPPVTLWFLADTADRVIATHIERSTLRTIGLSEVLSAFAGVPRESVESWTVTSPLPFGTVWVRVRR